MSAARRVVLAGAGHAHLHVATQAQAFAERGVELVLVDPGDFWYSGFATGMLGGQYEPADDKLDPGALIEAHGGRIVRDRVASLERGARRVHLAGGDVLPYDLLSFSIGSEGALPSGLRNQPDIVRVKPLENLWRLRESLTEGWLHGRTSIKVCILGGGATGCEVAANLHALARRAQAGIELTLITMAPRLLPAWPAGAARGLARVFRRRGIELVFERRIGGARDHVLIADNDREFPYDFAVAATGLRPPALLREVGLPTSTTGGLRVDARLRALDDHSVFGAGDCIHFNGRALPRLGVFGVRQAPVLLANLLATLDGRRSREYQPQSRYLSILNLGDGTGLALRGHLHWRGRASMWWKDRLDRRFLDGYRRSSSQ